ncbi:unnamed protein product [Closterium sp. NIES-65]|nr:unnamed protein product [Closterium sp. NIES-65]
MASYCRTVVPSAIPSSSFSPFRLDPPLFPHICSPALLPTPPRPLTMGRKRAAFPRPLTMGRKRAALPRLLSPSTSPLGFGGGGDGSSATLKITPVGLIVPLPFFLPFPPPLFLPSPSPDHGRKRAALPRLLSPSGSPLGFGGGVDGSSATLKITPLGLTAPLPPLLPLPVPPPCSRPLFPSLIPLPSPTSLSPPPLPPPPPAPSPDNGAQACSPPPPALPQLLPLGLCMRWSSADVAASLAARESLTHPWSTHPALPSKASSPSSPPFQGFLPSLSIAAAALLGWWKAHTEPWSVLHFFAEREEGASWHGGKSTRHDGKCSLHIVFLSSLPSAHPHSRPSPPLRAAAESLRGRKAHPGMVMNQQGMVPNTTAAAGSSSSQNPSKKANNEDGAANNEDRDPAGGADDDDEDDDEAGGGGLSSRRKEGARKLQQWREFFGGVVLVLHFSRWDGEMSVGGEEMYVCVCNASECNAMRAWQTLEFWRHVYGRVFDNMVTVSTEAIPELGVIAATPSPAANTDASLSYTALPTIMEQHASASGFLWLDDDAVLNYWALADAPLDKNKIWYLNSSNPSHLLTLPLDQPPSAPIRTALDPADLPTHISTSLSHLSESLRAQLDRSLWPRHLSFPLAASTSSAFFIPQRLVDSAALHVIPVFAAEAIPAQVAFPSSAVLIPQRLVDSAALHVIPAFAAEARQYPHRRVLECVLSWVKQTHSAALHVIPVFAFIAIPAQVAIPLILFTLKHPNQCISPTVPLTTPLLSPHPCSPHTPALPTPLLSPHPCSPLLPQVATPLILFTLQHPKQYDPRETMDSTIVASLLPPCGPPHPLFPPPYPLAGEQSPQGGRIGHSSYRLHTGASKTVHSSNQVRTHCPLVTSPVPRAPLCTPALPSLRTPALSSAISRSPSSLRWPFLSFSSHSNIQNCTTVAVSPMREL